MKTSKPVIPKRIQRKRTKGWKMPENTIYVGRPSKWGNPFKVTKEITQEKSVEMYKECILNNAMGYAYCHKYDNLFGSEVFKYFYWISTNIHKLKGANLSCWCKLSEKCHTDILLELANKEL
ncbi:MAG TPA: DUF4326 domain-containing protein [Bacteroidales bacterium]|nr:DUF4326 domain-containing protein [Bacteroidales bacterium]